MSVISALPPAIRSYVYDFDRRARRLALLQSIGKALAVFLVWMLVCCGLDRVARLNASVRLALLTVGVAAVVMILWRPVRRSLRKRVDWVKAAGQIEQYDPQFGQRLVTVTSRVLGPAEHRGSDDMLRELLRDVDRRASMEHAAALLPVRRIARPWLVCAIAALALAALVRAPDFQLPLLAARFLAPLADIHPATTTQLKAPTGSRDVVQSAPLVIEADVARLDPAGLVSLFISDDGGRNWSRSTMDRPTNRAAPNRNRRKTPKTQPAARGMDRYAFRFASVDRDLMYYITAGDATSQTYTVRVRRPPAVEKFSIRYEYPAYTGRAPLTVENNDGLIEAPTGTKATLTITATEPLDNALLTIGGEKILMDRLNTPESRGRMCQATIHVRRDGRYELDLISDRQVPGGGPSGVMLIRATPDAKPLVRLPQAGDNLRLHPREILSLPYQALDDYGIAKMTVTAQINSQPPMELPVELMGDVRRQERDYVLDLAWLPLGVGDVVTLKLIAIDRAGQRSSSDSVQVLVSPRSVDVTTYQRVSELNDAAAVGATLHDYLTEASKAIEEADREAPSRSLAYLAALNRANRQLTSASETGALMRQSLYRALVTSRSIELSNALAHWIDQSQSLSWLAEDLFRRAGAPTGMGTESRGLLATALESSRVMRDEIKSVAVGERAAAVLADRQNLMASQAKADATTQPADVKERLVRTLERAKEDIAAGAWEIGIDPAVADLDTQLQGRIDIANTLLRSKTSIDFVRSAQEWSQNLERDRRQPVALDERLSAAAQVEAVRGDADPLWARDLQLAARAAARIESLAQADPSGRNLGTIAFTEFVNALATLQREHEFNRAATVTQSADEIRRIHEAAMQGRVALQRWSAGPVEISGRSVFPGMRPRHSEAEELALRASAEMAARNYAAAAELDAAGAKILAETLPQTAASTGPTSTTPTTSPATEPASTPSIATSAPAPTPSIATTAPTTTPATSAPRTAPSILASAEPSIVSELLQLQQREIQRLVDRAKTLDRMNDNEEQPTDEAEGSDERGVVDPSGIQPDVDAAIDQANRPPAPLISASDPNWRSRATAAVLASQEALAAMPQQIAAAQEALPAWRDAVMRADQARRDAVVMPDAARQPTAQRVADQAERDAENAAEYFQESLEPLRPTIAQQTAANLESFAPETDGTREVIAKQLVPALQRLEFAATTGDFSAFGRSADDARQSIEAAQKELADAQDALTARDPLVAAKWFARAAADSFSRTSPDLRSAMARQRDTTETLSRAWDRTIHDAASFRVASIPSMESIFSTTVRPPAFATTQPGNGTGTLQTTNGFSVPLNAASPAMVREWNRGGAVEPSPSAAPLRDIDPPGFEEPLRLYFETLDKAGREPLPTTAPTTAPSTP